MAKTSQQFHLISFIKFCISGAKIQSLSNLREKKIDQQAERWADNTGS